MDVNIQTYMLIKMQYTHLNAPAIQDINNYMHDLNVTGKGKVSSKKGKIILKEYNQKAGGIKKIKIDNTKYEYNVDDITPYSNTQKMMSLVYLTDITQNCISIIYDTEKSGGTNAFIGGIINNEECIKCLDKKKKYKVGDILIQIVMKLLKTSKNFKHINTLELHDTSIKRCYDIGIQLRYLKMITDGRTYYSKYGFKPKKVKEDNKKESRLMTDYKKFKYNKELFNTERNLTRQDIADVIKESDIDDDGIFFYTKVVRPYLKKNKIIDTSIFIKDMLSLALEEQEEEDKKIICSFISKIYKNLYKKIGYKEYSDDCVWILKL